MQSSWLDAGKVLAIQLLFWTTFFLSASLKWSGGVPGWFIQQFQGTWLAPAPGGLPSAFYFLAVETIAFLELHAQGKTDSSLIQ